MKDTDITIRFNSEKLDALNFYMSKKDSDVQGELEETVQGLYLKHVPTATREYIEDRLEREGATSPPSTKAGKKPVPSAKKSNKKEKKEDKCEEKQGERKDNATSDSREDSTEDAEQIADDVSEDGIEIPNTQDTVDELLHGSTDEGNQSGEGDPENSSGDGFLDGLLN